MRTLGVDDNVWMQLRQKIAGVYAQFAAHKITKEEAIRQLQVAESWAYENDSEAEEDGQYTFAVAEAVDRLQHLP
jgi:hypothetical protein